MRACVCVCSVHPDRAFGCRCTCGAPRCPTRCTRTTHPHATPSAAALCHHNVLAAQPSLEPLSAFHPRARAHTHRRAHTRVRTRTHTRRAKIGHDTGGRPTLNADCACARATQCAHTRCDTPTQASTRRSDRSVWRCRRACAIVLRAPHTRARTHARTHTRTHARTHTRSIGRAS